MSRTPLYATNQTCTFFESWPKNRMLQIGLRFLARGDRIFDRGRAPSKAEDLREDEPHPMAHFFTGLEFWEYPIVDWVLRLDKTRQMESVVGLRGTFRIHTIRAVANS